MADRAADTHRLPGVDVGVVDVEGAVERLRDVARRQADHGVGLDERLGGGRRVQGGSVRGREVGLQLGGEGRGQSGRNRIDVDAEPECERLQGGHPLFFHALRELQHARPETLVAEGLEAKRFLAELDVADGMHELIRGLVGGAARAGERATRGRIAAALSRVADILIGLERVVAAADRKPSGGGQSREQRAVEDAGGAKTRAG